MIKKLVEYLYDDERKHFEECGEPDEHIFLVIKKIDTLLGKKKLTTKDVEEILGRKI